MTAKEPINASEKVSSQETERTSASVIKHTMKNLDRASTAAFVTAAFLGAIGVANNVRHSFWDNFILGFNKVNTPFAAIRDKAAGRFQSTVNDYNANKITATEYRDNMRGVANDYRNEVATKLQKEFDIPTHGVSGWTVGTYKRMKELGLTGRIHSVVSFASVAAITMGAVNVLRSSKNTIDRVEDKIDAGQYGR